MKCNLGFPIRDRSKVYLGTKYGGWYVMPELLKKDNICFCLGAGEDISFDMELYKRWQNVIIADPTPRAIDYVTKKIRNKRIQFYPVGVWDQNMTVKFYEPKNKAHVSHSIINLQETTEYFEAEVVTLKKLMEMSNVDRIDLIKLDIEGAEMQVLKKGMEDGIKPTQILIEFDELVVKPSKEKIEEVKSFVSWLHGKDYHIFAVDGKSNYCFVKNEAV